MFNSLKLFALNVSETVTDLSETTSQALENATPAIKETGEISIKFQPMEFIKNLDRLGIGMLCIFIVIGVIILSIYLINFFTNRTSEKDKAEKVPKEKKVKEKKVKEKKPKKEKESKDNNTAE